MIYSVRDVSLASKQGNISYSQSRYQGFAIYHKNNGAACDGVISSFDGIFGCVGATGIDSFSVNELRITNGLFIDNDASSADVEATGLVFARQGVVNIGSTYFRGNAGITFSTSDGTFEITVCDFGEQLPEMSPSNRFSIASLGEYKVGYSFCSLATRSCMVIYDCVERTESASHPDASPTISSHQPQVSIQNSTGQHFLSSPTTLPPQTHVQSGQTGTDKTVVSHSGETSAGVGPTVSSFISTRSRSPTRTRVGTRSPPRESEDIPTWNISRDLATSEMLIKSDDSEEPKSIDMYLFIGFGSGILVVFALIIMAGYCRFRRHSRKIAKEKEVQNDVMRVEVPMNVIGVKEGDFFGMTGWDMREFGMGTNDQQIGEGTFGGDLNEIEYLGYRWYDEGFGPRVLWD
jgi:hypothetical protein